MCSATPTPRTNVFDIINSRAGLRKQLVLKGLFDIVYGGEHDLKNVCDCFNEKFCNNNGYNYPLTYPTRAVDLNNIGITLIFWKVYMVLVYVKIMLFMK